MGKQLVRNMYDSLNFSIGLFGISHGNFRRDDFVHNGVWFNREGEKLGWGDLSKNDFRRISDEIDEDEIFIVLHEGDCWELAKVANVPEYVAEHARFVIGRGKLYLVSNSEHEVPDSFVDWDGIKLHVISKETMKGLMKP